ncbi:hypothetical protein PGTUg99_017921 [Puccinia graminis f. sp. tritici]|uniref:Uncharacterized protein n=1 Tax=Puccinia graminis f. sp. tritici TaxID=56615 RepID=A0A5B0S7H3_PUCGR|nr:hypothetical protein PGTUg99_017921 [Puccinia graminis f. sp. tritici]
MLNECKPKQTYQSNSASSNNSKLVRVASKLTCVPLGTRLGLRGWQGLKLSLMIYFRSLRLSAFLRSDQGAALSLSSMENGRLATGQTGPERTDPGWNSALGPPARICLETGYDMRTLRSTHYPLLPGRSRLKR